jgi:hypothetical protein
MTPLFKAAELKEVNIARLLIDSGANFHKEITVDVCNFRVDNVHDENDASDDQEKSFLIGT